MVEKKTWTPVLLFLGCTGFAVLLQFYSGFHSQQHGDSLLISIMSYTRPTMFYWGEDVFFNLLPLLFSFVKDPELNLFFITLAQLLCVFMFAYIAAGLLPARRKLLIWAIAVLLVGFLDRPFLLDAAFQPYAIALMATLMGLRALKAGTPDTGRAHLGYYALSAALILIAMKVAQPVFAIVLLWMGWILGSGLDVRKHESGWIVNSATFRRTMVRFCQWCVLFLLVYAAFAMLQSLPAAGVISHRKIFISIDLGKALKSLVAMFSNFEAKFDSAHILAGVVTLGTLGGYILLFAKRSYRALFLSIVLFVLPALIIAAMMSSLEWVRTNLDNPRYIILVVFLMLLNFAFVVERSVADYSLSLRIINFTQAGCIVGAATLIFCTQGPCFYQGIKERIWDSLKDKALFDSAIGRNGAIGDYWRVWPLVWTRNAFGDSDFIGISHRSEYVKSLILTRLSAAGSFELIAFADDNSVAGYNCNYLRSLLEWWFRGKDLQPEQVGPAMVVRGSVAYPRSGRVAISDMTLHRVGRYKPAEGALVSNQSEKGFLVYGPYVQLQAGDCVASIRISIEGKEGVPACWVDVFSSDTTPHLQILRRVKAGIGIQVVELPFKAEVGPAYEFRVWSEGTATIKVHDIEYHQR